MRVAICAAEDAKAACQLALRSILRSSAFYFTAMHCTVPSCGSSDQPWHATWQLCEFGQSCLECSSLIHLLESDAAFCGIEEPRCLCRTMTPPRLSPSKELLEAPIWTTWARYFSRVNQAKVLKYAGEIVSRGLQVNSQYRRIHHMYLMATALSHLLEFLPALQLAPSQQMLRIWAPTI